MDTVRIVVVIEPFESWFSDLLSAEMADAGFDSFVETDAGFEAYITDNKYNESTLALLFSEKKDRFIIHWQKETLADRNWNEEWEKNYFQPLVIQNKVLVRAPFHKNYPVCPVEIIIEPKMAFGTGNHETTSLMMEALLELSLMDKKVLDMGCGTGILAILASKLGASSVVAIDNDPWSFNATTENTRINRAGNVLPVLGDASSLGTSDFDIILVNIHKNVIVNDMVKYAAVLSAGGLLLCSGFFDKDLEDIRAAGDTGGLHFTGSRSRNHWMQANFMKG